MKIAVIEGDGVGREVIPAALRVLDAVHPDIKKVFLEVGAERFYRDGISISKDDINTIRDCDCLLFGAVDTPLEKGYTSVVLTLRKSLGLFSNIRPFKSHPTLTDKEFDFVIVRENTEGMYSGREKVREDEAWTTRVISRVGSERICRLAASIAMERGDRLTIVHKANILHSDRFFRDVCTGCVEDAGVEYDEMLVDACAYHLVRTPQRFGVIVTTNLFGDILSDLSAALAGSLGLCPSAQIGDDFAMFEPVHGSAPDIAGRGIANPAGAILSVAMMLRWAGLGGAELIEHAVDTTLNMGILTPDMGGTATTDEFTDSVLHYISHDKTH